jgi:hypothetical protein
LIEYASDRTLGISRGPDDVSSRCSGGLISSILERLGAARRLQWPRLDHGYGIEVPRDWRGYVRRLADTFAERAGGLVALFEQIHAIF